MSFLSRLFGKKKSASKPSENKQSNTNSNHSSKIFTNFKDFGLPEINFQLSGNLGLDIMAIVGKLDKELKSKGLSFDLKGFYYTKLLEDGTLKIPVVFQSEGKGYSLFFIYDEEQAKTFNSLKSFAKDSDYQNALYISCVDCKKTTVTKDGKSSFNISDMTYVEKPELNGEYAMWWNEKGDELFHKSKTKESLDGIYESMKGYESYILGYILSEIKMKGFEEFQRVALPDQEGTFVVKGPEFLNIVLSVSQEKGIRFQFPKAHASSQYRNRFLKQIHSSIEAFKIVLMIQEAPLDEEKDENGYDWYKFMTRVIEKKEKEDELTEGFVIGTVSFD